MSVLNRILFFRCLLIGALSWPFAVQSEDLLSLFQRARQEDATFQAARETALAAQEALPQAEALLLPELGFSAAHLNNHDSYRITSGYAKNSIYRPKTYSLTLNQPLFYYDRWMKLKEAQAQVKSVKMDFALAEQTLILQLAQRYFNCLQTKDTLSFAQAQRTAYYQNLQQAKQRHQVGLIADPDMELAKAKYDKTAAQEILAQSELANSEELLKEMVGRHPISTLAPLKEKLTLLAPSPTRLEDWVEAALQKNLALQSAEFKVKAAKTHIKTGQSGHLPQLSLVSSLGRSRNIPNDSAPGGTTRTASLGLQLTVPLFNGGAVLSKSRQAVHQYESIKHAREGLSRQTETATRDAYRKVLSQIENVQALHQAITSGQSALRATKMAFEVGTKTINDVLDAQRDLIQAQRDHAAARYGYVIESLKLKQATGILCPEDLQQINGWLEQPMHQR